MENTAKLPLHIEPLKKCFFGKGEVRGYKFIQVKKSDKVFIYEVTSDNRKHYEVFKKRVNTRFACESYPTSKGFGIWAYTCMTLERALAKFKELNSCD